MCVLDHRIPIIELSVRFRIFCHLAQTLYKGQQENLRVSQVDACHPKICLAAKERRKSVVSTKEETWRKKHRMRTRRAKR